jgi:flagellar FliJ protein
MKRFNFRLQKVLDIRAYYERLAEMKLANESGKCALLERRLEENARAAVEAAHERFSRSRNLFEMQTVELYIRRLDAEREKTLKALALAEAEREKARLEYVKASRDKQIIDKLRERREREYYRAASREEVKVLDDLSRAGKGFDREEA